MTRKLVLTLLIVCGSAGVCGNAQADWNHSVPCMTRHQGAKRYCQAIMHRRAIRKVRYLEEVVAKRANLRVHLSHKLGWNIAQLRRLNHQERVRLKKLRHLAVVKPPIPHEADWLCIHSYEGAWTDDTGNGYYGGLQMDETFMETYGPDMIRKYGGWANLWSPYDQMVVAERAYESGRGFYPWPNTARDCGLL